MKKNIHNYKVLKVIELGIFFVMEVLFLIILISNRTMRSSIFVDRSLFILCAIMYFTILLSLGFLIVDFIKLRELKIENHNLENLAYLDKQTGIPNRTSVNMLFESYSDADSMKGIGCVVSEIANIRDINSVLGKTVGDRVIHDFSKLYEKSADGMGFVGRNGGNEFITVLEKCNETRMKEFLDKLSGEIAKYNEENENINLSVRSEYVLFDSEEVGSFSELVAKAYKKLGR